jgi:hypothetical protein
MSGYIGTKSVTLSTTSANVGGDSTVSGDLTVDTNTLYVDSTNNRVGVGTASPSNPFQVGTSDLIVDSSGNVGIGCVPSSIQSGFDTLQIGGNLTLNVDSTGAGAGVYMGNNVYRDSSNSRWEYIYTDEATQYLQANGAHIWRHAASGTADTAITWSESMRIDSSGNLLVNTTSTSPNSGVALQPGIGNSNGNSGNSFIEFRRNATQIGGVTQSGTTGVSYNTSSDYRLKENVTDVTDGITRVKQLEPKRFNFIADPDTTVDGFLAHEAQAVAGSRTRGDHRYSQRGGYRWQPCLSRYRPKQTGAIAHGCIEGKHSQDRSLGS